MSKESANAYAAMNEAIGWLLIGACFLVLLWAVMEWWTHYRGKP